LALKEETGLPYASQYEGRMHACGHDGHTTMLLGAAGYLAAQPDFSATVNLIFQPAEEGRGGAIAMLKDGLFERFPSDAVYGLHNTPGMPASTFATCVGPMLAAADSWKVSSAASAAMAARSRISRPTSPMLRRISCSACRALSAAMSRRSTPA
jgi:amidohydrolase